MFHSLILENVERRSLGPIGAKSASAIGLGFSALLAVQFR